MYKDRLRNNESTIYFVNLPYHSAKFRVAVHIIQGEHPNPRIKQF